MTRAELVQWLSGKGFVVDARDDDAIRVAIIGAFTNKEAPAVDDSDIASFAADIGCTPKQIKAISIVESAGGGFTKSGLPKILFERHYFWRLTEGRHGVTSFSNSKAGGYAEDSWAKLTAAALKDPHAAFQSASWGKFQVMGAHWNKLGYRSPISFAFTMTRSEVDHYEALVRYIKAFGLVEEARALSTNPEANRAFAKGYNGTAYERFDYHLKLARAMK